MHEREQHRKRKKWVREKWEKVTIRKLERRGASGREGDADVDTHCICISLWVRAHLQWYTITISFQPFFERYSHNIHSFFHLFPIFIFTIVTFFTRYKTRIEVNTNKKDMRTSDAELQLAGVTSGKWKAFRRIT